MIDISMIKPGMVIDTRDEQQLIVNRVLEYGGLFAACGDEPESHYMVDDVVAVRRRIYSPADLRALPPYTVLIDGLSRAAQIGQRTAGGRSLFWVDGTETDLADGERLDRILDVHHGAGPLSVLWQPGGGESR